LVLRKTSFFHHHIAVTKIISFYHFANFAVNTIVRGKGVEVATGNRMVKPTPLWIKNLATPFIVPTSTH
jgi:hypothetical protein